jgi:hypothetical protein
MLSDWMADYVKYVADRYDLTGSEVIRVHMCYGFLCAISMIYPEYKDKLENNGFLELAKKIGEGSLNEGEIHQMMSKALFETRKAVEFRLSQAE